MNWKEWTALLYPPECPVCQKLLSDTEDRRRHIHGDCYRKLRRIVEPMCKRCGKPLLSAQQEYCYDCQRRSSACEAGHSLWMYDAVSSESIFAYKYDGKRAYADFYSQAVLHFYRDWIESLHVQQLIPVPLSQRKQRQRGFNQAALLAEKIAESVFADFSDECSVLHPRRNWASMSGVRISSMLLLRMPGICRGSGGSF